MLYIFLCLYPWSSYFLSFQTNHWSLLDINKTSSKQHHLGAQIINELCEMQSEGKSYLKLVHVHAKYLQSCLTLTVWTIARQDPMSMGFSRQEYRSGLPCSPSGVFPDPGIEPTSSVSPALQVDSLPLSHRGSRTCSFIQLNTDQDYFGLPTYSLCILQSSWNLLTPSSLHVYGHRKYLLLSSQALPLSHPTLCHHQWSL